MYVCTSFRGAKTCKNCRKGVFLSCSQNFVKDTVEKLRKKHAKNLGCIFMPRNMCLGCVLKVFNEDDIQPELQVAPLGKRTIGNVWITFHASLILIFCLKLAVYETAFTQIHHSLQNWHIGLWLVNTVPIALILLFKFYFGMQHVYYFSANNHFVIIEDDRREGKVKSYHMGKHSVPEMWQKQDFICSRVSRNKCKLVLKFHGFQNRKTICKTTFV